MPTHLPKAELHLHIEGTLEPELMFELARRNGLSFPYPSVDALRKAYEFADLASFLRLYYRGMSVLRTAQDFYDLASAYLQRARAQRVVHAEIFFDPQAHLSRGISFATVIDGLWSAMATSTERFGVTTKLIMCFLRDLPAESAMEVLEMALEYKDRIVAVGLDSVENGNPPSKFAAVFERAQEEGFLTVAHAGEEGPPEYVWQALELLNVSRVDHGVRSMEDQELIRHLSARQIPLTVCPLSNVKLKVFRSLEAHNLKKMLDAGLRVTVNSDDPAYFGGYVDDNYVAVQEALALSGEQMRRIAENSFEASFLSDDEKRAHIAALNVVGEL